MDAWNYLYQQVAAYLYDYSPSILLRQNVVMQLPATILFIQTLFSSAFRGAAVISETTVYHEN